MISFINPGEIDPRLITTLGVNVKEGESPIGFFGTGLKYAIAVLLRERHSVEIFSGEQRFAFSARPETIRGKEFNFIYMNEAPLGFTTELGKNWQLWQACRELLCNAWDEGGDGTYGPARPQRGHTVIQVTGPAFEQIFAERTRWTIGRSETPLYRTNDLEIYPLRDPAAIFYRGIKVAEAKNPLKFSYNILSKMTLTEDRTVDLYYIRSALATEMLFGNLPTGPLQSILLAAKDSFEGTLDYRFHANTDPSPLFLQAVEDLYQTQIAKCNASAIGVYLKYRPRPEMPSVLLTSQQKAMIEQAQRLASFAGYNITEPIRVVWSLGENTTVGAAVNSEILLTPRNFEEDVEFLCATLIEEHVHISRNLPDCSRQMQDHLFDRIVMLAKRLAS